MFGEPQKEHAWLQRFLGTWDYDHDCPENPGKKLKGRQTFSSLGGFWIVGDGTGEMPGGGPAKMLLTIGYDPAKGRYVGTWVGSMMANLWVYDGELDATGKVLTLQADGPSFSGDGTIVTYQDIIEVKSDDHYEFRGQVRQPDGSWHVFMRSDYRRAA
jgi:hypothetical protein